MCNWIRHGFGDDDNSGDGVVVVADVGRVCKCRRCVMDRESIICTLRSHIRIAIHIHPSVSPLLVIPDSGWIYGGDKYWHILPCASDRVFFCVDKLVHAASFSPMFA